MIKLKAQECYDVRTKSLRRTYITKKGYPHDDVGDPVFTITFLDFVKDHTPSEVAKKFGLRVAQAAQIKKDANSITYKKLLDESKACYKLESVINFEDEDAMEAEAVDYGMLKLPAECIERLKKIRKKKGKK